MLTRAIIEIKDKNGLKVSSTIVLMIVLIDSIVLLISLEINFLLLCPTRAKS
jgi:hypothetical protein